jgi:hypothetical protein
MDALGSFHFSSSFASSRLCGRLGLLVDSKVNQGTARDSGVELCKLRPNA